MQGTTRGREYGTHYKMASYMYIGRCLRSFESSASEDRSIMTKHTTLPCRIPIRMRRVRKDAPAGMYRSCDRYRRLASSGEWE